MTAKHTRFNPCNTVRSDELFGCRSFVNGAVVGLDSSSMLLKRGVMAVVIPGGA